MLPSPDSKSSCHHLASAAVTDLHHSTWLLMTSLSKRTEWAEPDTKPELQQVHCLGQPDGSERKAFVTPEFNSRILHVEGEN